MSLFLKADDQIRREYFPSGTSSLLELCIQHVSVQTEVYFKKCVSRLTSASGYPSRCCVVIYKGNILKVWSMLWSAATNFRTCQMLTEKGNLCACAQRFIINEHNKEEGAMKNNVSTIARKAHTAHTHCSKCFMWQNLEMHVALNVIITIFRRKTATM